MLKILYFCNKRAYDTKMSRVRFHGMRTIGKSAEVIWSGLGWPNYDSSKTAQENIDKIFEEKPKPDVVVAYKPLELNGFCDINIPKCIRYNEMFDTQWTKKEIVESKPNLIVCHHKNDMLQYQEIFKNYAGHPTKFVYVAHCAEKMIYKDYKMPKKWDVLLAGAVYTKSLLGDHYPLRIRFAEKIMPRLSEKYNCHILRHPGGNLYDATSDRNSFEYAQTLNSAKICLTCSGRPRSRFGKYSEIPMCASALAADLPDEDHEFFKKFMITLNNNMTDDEMVDKITYYLENEEEREKIIQKGLELNKEYTQEKYAERFLKEIKEFLDGMA